MTHNEEKKKLYETIRDDEAFHNITTDHSTLGVICGITLIRDTDKKCSLSKKAAHISYIKINKKDQNHKIHLSPISLPLVF